MLAISLIVPSNSNSIRVIEYKFIGGFVRLMGSNGFFHKNPSIQSEFYLFEILEQVI